MYFFLGQRVRTGGVEPPQREATGLQPAELSGAQRPRESCKGVTDRIRTGTSRFTTSGAGRYTTATMRASVAMPNPRAGTAGLEPAASRLTSERSARLSYAPKAPLAVPIIRTCGLCSHVRLK